MFNMILRLLNFSSINKKRLLLSFVYGFFSAMFEIFPIFAILLVLSGLMENTVSMVTVYTSFAIIFAGILGQIICNNASCNRRILGSYNMCSHKRLSIGERMKNIPMGFFSKSRKGDIVATLTSTINDLEMSAVFIFQKLVNGFLHALVLSCWLMSYDVRLGFLSLAGIALSQVIYSFLQRKSLNTASIRQESQSELIGAILEYIQGMAVVKAFAANKSVERTQSALRRAIEKSCASNKIIESTATYMGTFYQGVFKMLSFFILITACYMLTGGGISQEKALLLFVASFFLYTNIEIIGSVASLARTIQHNMLKVEELEQQEIYKDAQDNFTSTTFDIAFKNVSFAYENEKIFNNMNLYIPEKSKVALVGPSGSGKSTLCHLIARFWDVQGGEISIAGKNICDIPYAKLMQHISIVFQDVYLFEDTVANNIKFGLHNASQSDIENAAKNAQCHDFIMQLPQGYETIIGEGGANLSGGEKQRISIARALLKNADIIILDEMTSALDPENECALVKAVEKLIHGKTVIMIAHRLSTIQSADIILVLEKGHIVQQGTHDTLMEETGIYKKFVALRSAAQEWVI